MPAAVKVTMNNVLPVMRMVNNLYVGVASEILYNQSIGFPVTVLITDGAPATNNLTYTFFVEEDFDRMWEFSSEEVPNMFTPIQRKA